MYKGRPEEKDPMKELADKALDAVEWAEEKFLPPEDPDKSEPDNQARKDLREKSQKEIKEKIEEFLDNSPTGEEE